MDRLEAAGFVVEGTRFDLLSNQLVIVVPAGERELASAGELTGDWLKRLSIANPFPAPFNDCYATLSWVHANAHDLGVDPERVALIGDSAGGALAAGVAQQALDRGENPVCAQILIYPVTDHETKTESALKFTDTPFWKTASNRNMWNVYLRESEHKKSGGSAPVPSYAAPLHRESFAGLPPAWVEVAEFDPMLDEGRLYAEALRGAGVPVEFREVKSAIHGFDLVEGSETAELSRLGLKELAQ